MLNLFYVFLLSNAFAQEKVNIKNFTPQGFVKSVDQIRIEFSKPMVRFGDIKLDYPAQSSCFQNGQGRWVDTKNWVFDFKDSLPGGSSCEVTVAGKTFKFNTGGPHIKDTFPRRYRPVEPEQSFILMLDAPVKKESLEKGVYFIVEGIGDRAKAKLIEGKIAKEIKDAAEVEYKWESGDGGEEGASQKNGGIKGEYVIVKGERPFPPGAKVSLVWSKEIQSLTGYDSPTDEVFEFVVAEPFKAKFSCEREAPEKPCVPPLSMHLTFSSPISVKDARGIFIEDGQKRKIIADKLDDDKESVSYLEFVGPFQQNAEYKLFVPADIKDQDGRILSNRDKFPLNIKTGENPSLLKFAANFGIVEGGPEAAVALTLRRVEKSVQTKFAGWTGKFDTANFKNIINILNEVQKNPYGEQKLSTLKNIPFQNIQVQKPSQPSDTEVIGIPLKKNGFYLIEMISPLLGESLLNRKAPFYVRSASLVTNMALHLKFSSREAWVWVTNLKNAKVIPEANIRIFDANGMEVAQAKTDSHGLAYVQFKKILEEWPSKDGAYYRDGFYAVAEKGDDFTFTHSSWDRGVESWRYQLDLPYVDKGNALIGHAILDRTLFKPEETLSAKILLRKTEGKGLTFPSAKEWPSMLVLNHDSGLQTFKVPVQWDKQKGTAVVKWTLPAGVKLGHWSLTLEEKTPAMSLMVGNFAVESFRVPLIQLRIDSPTPSFVQEKKVELQINGSYFSGGPALDLPLKMRWSVEPHFFDVQDDDLKNYTFANGAVKEGLFRSGEDESARHIPQSGIENLQLDKRGSVKAKIENLKYGSGPQKLRTEIEYKDPSGEIKTVIRSYSMWPSDVILGIKSKSWWATPDLVEFDVIALDTMQKPLQNQNIQVDLYTSRYYSHRKKLVGGFFAYEDFREFKKIGELCQGRTNNQGTFSCAGKTKKTGSVLAVVSSKDSEGRESFANVNQWIISPGETQWFGSDDHDRADLIPFRRSYEPGEVAELQLRTPFPEAKVLVTVERDTVLHTEIVEVKGERPVIQVPIKKEYAPNVVISAFAIRGRLNEPKPTAIVDLGKPAFKLGMANIKVGLKHNTLKVTVNTDRKSYKARQRALVTVKVTDSEAKAASNGEIALVAVDEGLLELRDNTSWDLLNAMMKLRPHTMETATNQTWIIGKRHFGLKALPVGGDGGGVRRELFDTLLYWNPSIPLDKNGEVRVEVPLNDSTTSFKIVAIATKGTDQFGTGWTSIQSSQDIMILPGLPGVAREGDVFAAGFTVRNASNLAQDLSLSLKVNSQQKFEEQKIHLNPGEAKEVSWQINAAQAGALEYILTAKNAQGKTVDEIKKVQKIVPLREARIYQTQWGSWPEFAKLSLKQPATAEPQKSSILVELSEGLGGSFTGIKEFWKNYEYTCLEQLVSRAVSLNDKKMWQKLEEKIETYIDGNGLLKYFPGSFSKGSVNLTAYVMSVVHEAGFSFSHETEGKLLQALSNYADGRFKEDVDVPRIDETLKKISVFEALSRYRRLNIDLLTSLDYRGTEWPLYTLVEWYQIHLWEKNIPQRDSKLVQIENQLRSRFYFSAKRLQLKEEKREMMSWLMRNSDSSILRLILATLNKPQWKEDTPRLYQGILSRQKDGAWLITADNAWGSVVMRKVQAAYSKEKVQGDFKVEFEGKTVSHSWSKESSASFDLPWTQNQPEIKWQQQGKGKPWISVSAKVSLPVTKSIFAGFTVEKTVTPIEQKHKGSWSVGDTAKVQLKIKTAAPQTWVVIEDPIPSGSSVLQSSWATAVERKEELVRFYYEWFTGSETVEYTVRFNQAGKYKLPVTRAEAMYSPDLFAELPESSWIVNE